MFALGTIGVGGLGFWFACGVGQACSDDLNATLDPNQSNDLVPALVMTGSIVTAVVGFLGGALIVSEMPDPDGTLPMHVLSEAEARGAIDRYNEALKTKIARDLGE